MSAPAALTATPIGAGARAAADTRLRGRRLAVAQVAWLVSTVFALVVFVAGISIYVGQLQPYAPAPAVRRVTSPRNSRADSASSASLPETTPRTPAP